MLQETCRLEGGKDHPKGLTPKGWISSSSSHGRRPHGTKEKCSMTKKSAAETQVLAKELGKRRRGTSGAKIACSSFV